MTEIFLVRHPESELNTQPNLVSGRSNEAGLTALGRKQAQLFSKAFVSSFPRPDVLYSSPAIRTMALAETYAATAGFANENIVIEPALQEMTQGVADGKESALYYTPDVLARIDAETFDFKLPEGESLNEVADRMLAWIQTMGELHPQKTILATTHGQAIRAVIGRLLGWTHYQTTRDPEFHTPNVSVTRISVTNGIITVSYANRTLIETPKAKK